MKGIRYKPIHRRCEWEICNSFYPMSFTYLVRDGVHMLNENIIYYIEISCAQRNRLL